MFKLMDVTLREGSYVVNNALTKSESKKLVHELNKAKIDLDVFFVKTFNYEKRRQTKVRFSCS